MTMAMLIFADQATEAVSERSFSIHSLYTSKLRKSLGPKIIAAMVRCKVNHALFWDKIEGKIWDRYVEQNKQFREAFPECDPSLEDDDGCYVEEF